MEWMEANPLPNICLSCKEAECYNCEHAGERWYLSRKDELHLRRKSLIKAIERLQKQVRIIDEELTNITE